MCVTVFNSIVTSIGNGSSCLPTLPTSTVVGSIVSLEYPNGRIHEASVAMELEPGTEFDLYGRHWQAIGLLRPRGATRRTPLRMLCRAVGVTGEAIQAPG